MRACQQCGESVSESMLYTRDFATPAKIATVKGAGQVTITTVWLEICWDCAEAYDALKVLAPDSTPMTNKPVLP